MSDHFEHQALANKISKLIDSGIYKVGDRLPSEQNIARNFNVSRACVRDAKIILEAQGVLERKGRSGAYINEARTPQYNIPLEISALELIQTRALIEAEAAALAAPIITDTTLTELERYIDIMTDRNASNSDRNEADAAFHITIAKVTNNQMIIFFIQSMWKAREEFKELQELYRIVCNDNSNKQEHEHLKILNALKDGCSKKSRIAMREHFDWTLKVLIEASEKAEFEEVKRKALEKRSRFLLASQIS